MIFLCQVPYKDFLSFSCWFGLGIWGCLVFFGGEAQLSDSKVPVYVPVVQGPVLLSICISWPDCKHAQSLSNSRPSWVNCQRKVFMVLLFSAVWVWMKKGGNKFPLDEKVLNLFSNSLLRTTLPLTETEIARHVTHFFSALAEQKQTCPVFLVPCPLTILLLTDSSIPASSELYSNVCNVLKNLSDSLLLLECVTFLLFSLTTNCT